MCDSLPAYLHVYRVKWPYTAESMRNDWLFNLCWLFPSWIHSKTPSLQSRIWWLNTAHVNLSTFSWPGWSAWGPLFPPRSSIRPLWLCKLNETRKIGLWWRGWRYFLTSTVCSHILASRGAMRHCKAAGQSDRKRQPHSMHSATGLLAQQYLLARDLLILQSCIVAVSETTGLEIW